MIEYRRMATLPNIITLSEQRTSDTLYNIYVHKEPDSKDAKIIRHRCYGLSAMYVSFLTKQYENREVNVRKSKFPEQADEDAVTCVSWRVNAGEESKQLAFATIISETQELVVYRINDTSKFNKINVDNYSSIVKEWEAELPLAINGKRKNNKTNTLQTFQSNFAADVLSTQKQSAIKITDPMDLIEEIAMIQCHNIVPVQALCILQELQMKSVVLIKERYKQQKNKE